MSEITHEEAKRSLLKLLPPEEYDGNEDAGLLCEYLDQSYTVEKKLLEKIVELQREIGDLKIPDMFWDWDDSEQMIDGGLDEFFACSNADDGAIFRMECAQRLPDQYYIIEYPSNDEVENYRECTPEEIAEYKRRKKERKST